MEYPEISIVIGSWGSYNSCNQRALGSEWLNLADFESWEEIEEELKKQGFRLKGIDEELFIQDIDGIPSSGTNWDYVHPKDLFEVLKGSGVLDDNRKYDTMLAYLEVAVKHYRRKLYCKAVAWHGVRSPKCYIKDLEYCYCGSMGFRVGWHDEGIQKERRWYERGVCWAKDRYYDFRRKIPRL